MGNELSVQLRLTDADTVRVISNESLESPTERCQTLQKPLQPSLTEEDPVAQIKDKNTEHGLCDSSNQQISMSSFLEIEQGISESGIENSAMEDLQAEKDEPGRYLRTKFTSRENYEGEYEKKLKCIRETAKSLDDSLDETRGLETENSFRYSQLKTKNMSLQIDLDRANKRNKNMLNLFRQNAAEIGFGNLRTSSTLPESLKKDVHRIWSQKYDALLEQNNQLKKESNVAEFSLKDKDRQIEDLQQRLLNLAEDLIQRDKTIEKLCTKFLSLKQRKDKQEILLRGSVETLQDELQKAKNTLPSSKSESFIIPSKDTLIAREIRRSDRLAYENALLRNLLQEAKRSCRSSRTSSTISLCDKKF